jgi:hypothetical protein
VLVAPAPQHRRRRAEAGAGVHKRRAAHPPARPFLSKCNINVLFQIKGKSQIATKTRGKITDIFTS